MKMYKLALLGGAAFAVTAASAQADELSDLKAQLAALQSRVAQIETQPAQASNVPAGASLVMFKSGQAFTDSTPIHTSERKRADEGFSIAVTPTADMPAPVAEVTVTGNVRTLLVYSDINTNNDNDDDVDTDKLDVVNRTRLLVDGKTETAVGEVGAHMRLQVGDPIDGDVSADMNEVWGYWQMNDSWRLQAGRWDNTSAVQSGLDWDATVGATGGLTNSGVEQIRLIYTNGPITWAVAVEDPQSGTLVTTRSILVDPEDPEGDRTFERVDTAFDDISDLPDLAAYIQYNGDGLMLMASGVAEDDDIGDDTNWFVGAGARFGLGDVAAISLAAGWGDGYARNSLLPIGPDNDYWGVSGLLTFNLNDTTRTELGAGYEEADVLNGDFDPETGEFGDHNVNQWVINGGVYWDPVSQLTLGIQADYTNTDANDNRFNQGDEVDQFAVRFGTWFRF